MNMRICLVTGLIWCGLAGRARAQLVAPPDSAIRSTASWSASVAIPSAAMQARENNGRLRQLIRIGKWTLLGSALGLGAYAVVHSQRAEKRYEELRAICDGDASRCQLTPSGQYADAGAEDVYRAAIDEDRQAQVGIIGGQISLLGSVALFIADLRHGEGPSDIPYPAGKAQRVGIGLRIGR